MTDIDIAGLERMRDRMTHMSADIRPAGLVLIPAGPETFPVNWVPFYRKDLDTLLAALKSRDDRIAELESEMEDVQNDLKWEKEERADEVEAAEKKLEAVEKERDDLIQKLDNVERELYDAEKERDAAADDLRDLTEKAEATEADLRRRLDAAEFALANAETRIYELGGTDD